MARRCAVCGAGHAACRSTTDQPVDVYERYEPMGELKRYDVSGLDSGGGRPYPEGTILKLDRKTAEKLGLEKPSRQARADADDKKVATTEVASKPRTTTRKRARRR